MAPFVMHETVSMIPGVDFAQRNGEYALSARGALKMALCTVREDVTSPDAWIRLERFQERVSGMLAARAAMTGKADLDALLDEQFVPKIRAAGNARGADAFADAMMRAIEGTPGS